MWTAISGRDLVCCHNGNSRADCAHCTDFIRLALSEDGTSIGVYSHQMNATFMEFYNSAEADDGKREECAFGSSTI